MGSGSLNNENIYINKLNKLINTFELTSKVILHKLMCHQLDLHKRLIFLVGLSKIVTENKNRQQISAKY